MGAQPRKEGLGTQPRCSISEEALLPQGAEGQRVTVRGHGRSGSAMLLYWLSGMAPGTGNLLCQGRDFLGTN